MNTTRRSLLAAAVTGIGAAALAACSPDLPAAPRVSAKSTAAHPVLDADRLTAILTRVGDGLAVADKAKNVDDLTGFLTGPAERIRGEEYALASAAGDDTLIHSFKAVSQAGAVGLTMDFPRQALVITEPTSSNDSPYMLALDQDDARSSFELWAWARLFAGVEVPATNTASVGSPQVDAATPGLVATPEEVLANYVDALNNPEGTNGKAFEDDPLRQRIASERGVDLSGMGTVTVTAQAGSDGFKGLMTADGGALVMTTLSFTTVYAKTVAGATLNVGGNVGKLAGDTEVRGTVTAAYDIMVAFSIPSKEAGGQPVALGADLVLASVTRDDSQAPAE